MALNPHRATPRVSVAYWPASVFSSRSRNAAPSLTPRLPFMTSVTGWLHSSRTLSAVKERARYTSCANPSNR